MVEDSKPDNKPAAPHKSVHIPNVGEIAAYPLAAIAGYSVIGTEMRKASYKNLVTQGLFNDLQQIRKAEYQSILREATESGGKDMVPAIHKLELEYRDAVRERFQSMGIKSMEDYWQILKRNQKQNVAILGATVSGVVLGAILTVANNQNLWSQFDKLSDKLDSRER